MMKWTFYLNPIEAWRSLWFNLPYVFMAMLIGIGNCASAFADWTELVTFKPAPVSYFWRSLNWRTLDHFSDLYKG